MLKLIITSSIALVIYCLIMIGAYIWATYYPDAPFLAFATQLTIGFVAFITKRLIQKQDKYNSKNE